MARQQENLVNSLTADEEYEHSRKIWNKFKIKQCKIITTCT